LRGWEELKVRRADSVDSREKLDQWERLYREVTAEARICQAAARTVDQR